MPAGAFLEFWTTSFIKTALFPFIFFHPIINHFFSTTLHYFPQISGSLSSLSFDNNFVSFESHFFLFSSFFFSAFENLFLILTTNLIIFSILNRNMFDLVCLIHLFYTNFKFEKTLNRYKHHQIRKGNKQLISQIKNRQKYCQYSFSIFDLYVNLLVMITISRSIKINSHVLET